MKFNALTSTGWFVTLISCALLIQAAEPDLASRSFDVEENLNEYSHMAVLVDVDHKDRVFTPTGNVLLRPSRAIPQVTFTCYISTPRVRNCIVK